VAGPEAGQSIGVGGVIWLIALFVGIVFWAFRSKNRKRFQKDTETSLRDRDTRP
jgi:cbb3-type cytochrome oxidase subunit 3